MQKIRIGGWQVATIFANLVFSKAIGYTSEVMARRVSNDAWLAMAIAFLFGLLHMSAVVWLASRFPRESPGQYIPRLAGRWIGSLLLLCLAFFLFGSFITSAITVEQHISDYMMTETPLLVFVVICTLVCIIGAYLGIEVAARLSLLGLLMNILLNLLMVIGSIDHFHGLRLLPLFDSGLPSVLAAATTGLPDVAMATVSALFLLPMVDTTKGWYRFSLVGLLIGGVLVTTWPLFEVAVLGPEMTAQYLIACMQLARAAELSIYLHRYEMVMVVLFFYGVLTQSIVCLYGACELTAAALPFKVKRTALIAVAGVLTMGPNYLLAYDRDYYALFLDLPWPALTAIFGVGLSLLLCLIALMRRRLWAPRAHSRPSHPY